MQPTAAPILAFSLLLATSLHAQFNPLDWFGGEDEDLVALNLASAADESEATALLNSAKTKLASGSTDSAERNLKKIIKKYPETLASGDARFLYGQILMGKGRWVKAFDSLQEIIFKHPSYENFNQVLSAQFGCATALMEGARGRILWIIPGFKQHGIAASQFEQIVRNAPFSDYAPLALMNIALIYEQEQRPEDAIDTLDRLINYYPQSMLAPDAYHNMAQTYSNLVNGAEYDQGSTRQAISYYEDFLILFPQNSSIGEVESKLVAMENLLAKSRLNLGDFFYHYRSNNTAALVFYNETITIAPKSESAEEARARIADIEAGVQPTTGASIVRGFLVD